MARRMKHWAIHDGKSIWGIGYYKKDAKIDAIKNCFDHKTDKRGIPPGRLDIWLERGEMFITECTQTLFQLVEEKGGTVDFIDQYDLLMTPDEYSKL